MSGNRTVKVVIAGDSSGAQSAAAKASAALGGTATAGEKMSSRIGGVFSKMGGQLGGEVGDILTRVGEGFDHLGEKGMSAGKKMMASGGGLAGVGAVLTGIGSGEKEATAQLSAAITASGGSIEEYGKKIEEAVKHNEKFAFGAKDTTASLTVLTEATNSPEKALSEMGVVTDLAAAKHISLAEAGALVAKILGGAGAKTLKAYGITMDSTKTQTTAYTAAVKAHNTALTTLATAQKKLSDLEQVDSGVKKLSVSQTIALKNAHDAVAKAQTGVTTTTTALAAEQGKVKTTTQNADAALGLLANKLSGQASASVDSWGGKWRVLKTKIEDTVASMGAKYGPAITGIGTVLMAAGAVTEMFAARSAKAMQAAAVASESSSSRTAAANAIAAASDEEAAAGGETAAAKHAASSLVVSSAAESSSAAVVNAEAAAGAAEEEGAAGSQVAATEHVTAGATVAAAAEGTATTVQAAEAIAMAAEEEGAAASMTASDKEVAAYALTATAAATSSTEVAASAEASAAAVVAASEETATASSMAFGPIGIAIGAVVGIGALAAKSLGLFGSSASKQVKPTQDFTNAILADNLALGANTRKLVENTLEKDGMYDAGVKLGVSQQLLTDAAMGNTDALTKVNVAIEAASGSAGGAQGAFFNLTAGQKEAFATAGKLSSGLGNVKAILNANTTAANNLAAADGKLKPVKLTVNDNASGALRSAANQANNLNGSLQAVMATISALNLLSVAAPGAGGGSGGATATGSMSQYPHHAVGASSFAGGPTWLDEEGPELVDLPAGSKIHTAHQTEQMRSGGSGGDIVVHNNLVLDGAVIHTSLLRLKRNKGGSLLGIA